MCFQVDKLLIPGLFCGGQAVCLGSSVFVRGARILLFLILVLSGLLFRTDAAANSLGPERCIVVDKGRRTLTLYLDGKVVSCFPVSLGLDPVSDKRRSGDSATPEGCYYVTYKKGKSRFHLFVGISYPNEVDAWHAWWRVLIPVTDYISISDAAARHAAPFNGTVLGGGLGIHGGGVYRDDGGRLVTDWTEGCVALDDQAMEEVFSFCAIGDRVIIYNSKQEFFHMISPFAGLATHNPLGWPICPKGICTSLARADTSLGRMLLRLREANDYSRSVEIEIYPPGEEAAPSLVFWDANGDGRAGFGDWLRGEWDGKEDLAGIYQRLRTALLEALARGAIVPAVRLRE